MLVSIASAEEAAAETAHRKTYYPYSRDLDPDDVIMSHYGVIIEEVEERKSNRYRSSRRGEEFDELLASARPLRLENLIFDKLPQSCLERKEKTHSD